MKHSAPGPDGIPYGGWLTEAGCDTLHRVLMWSASSQDLPLGELESTMVFIPKAVQASEGMALHREPSDTRPLSLKNCSHKILGTAVSRSVAHVIEKEARPAQRGIVPHRGFQANVMELDGKAKLFDMQSAHADDTDVTRSPALVFFDVAATFPASVRPSSPSCLQPVVSYRAS